MIDQHFLWVGSTALVCSGAYGLSTGSINLLQVLTARKKLLAFEQERQLSITEKLEACYTNHRQCERNKLAWRQLLVARVVTESADTKSFYLVDPTGDRLPPFKAGQHVLIQAPISDRQIEHRCYSLSNAPTDGYWRISVKRSSNHTEQTSVSRWLHASLHDGSRLSVKGPSGTFHSDLANNTVMVLLAAGVGITPMMSMIEAWSKEFARKDLFLFYQVRNSESEAFAHRLRTLQEKDPAFHLNVFHSNPFQTQSFSQSLQPGRFSAQEIYQKLGSRSATYLMCGPEPWMESLRVQLTNIGIPRERIHSEEFGSALSAPPVASPPTTELIRPHRVTFAKTKASVDFDPKSIHLLKTAQENQAAVESGCGKGSCGSCVTKLLRGNVRYLRPPQCDIPDGHAALCVAVPDGNIELDA